jgi:hypothetical protein
MKWTKEQFLEATKSLYRMKSLMYKVEDKYNFKIKYRQLKLMDRYPFERKFNPLKRKIAAMEREIYLNMLHNGIEGEDNDTPPDPASTHKEKQIFKDTI